MLLRIPLPNLTARQAAETESQEGTELNGEATSALGRPEDNKETRNVVG